MSGTFAPIPLRAAMDLTPSVGNSWQWRGHLNKLALKAATDIELVVNHADDGGAAVLVTNSPLLGPRLARPHAVLLGQRHFATFVEGVGKRYAASQVKCVCEGSPLMHRLTARVHVVWRATTIAAPIRETPDHRLDQPITIAVHMHDRHRTHRCESAHLDVDPRREQVRELVNLAP